MEKQPRIEKLKLRKEQIEARIKNLESKERTREKKLDTRRKILIGAFYMEQMEKNEDAKKKIIARLDGFLTRPMDRELFGLPAKSQPTKKSDPPSKPAEKRKAVSTA